MFDNDKSFIIKNIDLFCCPKCSGDLTFNKESFSVPFGDG